MALTPEQHARRYFGIGGSDAAAALGISSRKTQYMLWHEKTHHAGVVKPQGSEEEWQDAGQFIEPAILGMLAKREGRAIVKWGDTLETREYGVPMLANLDGVFVPTNQALTWDEESGLSTDAIAEAKNVDLSKVQLWGDEGSDDIPLEYLVQCVHYLIVTKVPLCITGALFGGNRLKRYRIPARNDVIDMVIEGERAFWRMVQDGTPPEVTTLADAKLRYPRDTQADIEATPDIAAAMVRLRTLRAGMDANQELINEQETIIKAFMGDAATLTQFGIPIATWKTQKARQTFDFDAFGRDHPDLYKRYAGTGATPRVFRLKEIPT